MQWNVGDAAVLVIDGEGDSPRVHADRRQRDDSLLVGDPVVVTHREFPLGEFGIPSDAMEQILERLHAPLP
jgi:hypothetical protein